MDIFLQIIGFSFIPLLGVLVYSGINDIFCGLKEHYGAKSLKINELPFNQKAHEFISVLSFRKIDTDFCKG